MATKKPAVESAAPAADKKKALETAMAQIERNYGKGSIMRLGENLGVMVESIPTGSLSLDLALGIGGLPKGRIIEVYGPESSGKTTLALAFSKVLGLRFKRIQFTTDTLPSDITGFTVFNQQTGEFEYREGAANCQLLLADEINRTSPKTQSALLEVMEERSVTVDSQTHQLDAPFLCIATQNPAGAAGTQPLPDSQLDRFMVRLPIGYPSREDQIHIVQAQRLQNPLDDLSPVTDATSLIEVQQYLGTVHASDSVLGYAVDLCQATRELPLVELGVSPRGVGALVRMSRAHALLEQRDYVVPEDVQAVFSDVCAHRLVLRPQARVEGVTSQDLLTEVLRQVPPPAAPRWPHA